MTSTRQSINPFRTLQKHRNFRIFWIGQTVSLIGAWMQSMAQGWLALELSDSALVVGLVSFAGSLPIVLLSLQAGVLISASLSASCGRRGASLSDCLPRRRRPDR